MIKLNPRLIKSVTLFLPSMATYGATAGLAVLFFTSQWRGKAVLEHIPFYNQKYNETPKLFP
ncbi:hypothetical protein TCAL_10475 [Tigriopus californicus]|uniref:Uncharacterized protein n=1 Tax=Tigriopus californicus TaxID=6832 RepID=A0A553NPR6_TIGCA|nr:hypothetical protein TCAL_10475 [Tigriopus californicus]